MFTIPEDCPPRVSHSPNEYLPSDNLFNKAKSLTDSSEILITHEFSFDDIPEGIPLEDPLYDLNRDDIAYLTKYNEVQEARTDNKENTEAYSNYITNVSKEVDENMDANNYTKLSINSIQKQSVDDHKSIDDNKAIGISNIVRKGHSIQFKINTSNKNFNKANTRVNDDTNFYFRQSSDQSHLYPGQMFFEFNPYSQRIEKQNADVKHYEEAKTRPYDIINDYYKERKSFIKEQEYFNRKTDIKAKTDEPERHADVIDLTPNKHINSRNEKTQATIKDSTAKPITVQNEHSHPDAFVSDTNPDSQSTSKPEGFDVIKESVTPVHVHNAYPETLANSQEFHIINSNIQDSRVPEVSSQRNPNFSNIYPPSTLQTNKDPENIGPQINSDLSNNSGVSTSGPNLNIHDLDSNIQSNKENSQIFAQIEYTGLSSYNPNLSNYNPNPQYAPSSPYNTHLIASNPNNIGIERNDGDLTNTNPGVANFNAQGHTQYKGSDNIDAQVETPGANIPSALSSQSNTDSKRDSAHINEDRNYGSGPPNFTPGRLKDYSTENQPVKSENVGPLDNPKLSDFHVIDSETDLEVPTGMEGPIPAIALPPQNFVAVAPPPGKIF